MSQTTVKPKRITRRRIALALFILFLITISYGWAYTSISPTTIHSIIQTIVGYWRIEPPFSAQIFASFTVSGLLSANNPVQVHVEIKSINITNLGQYYSAMAFTDAYFQNGSEIRMNLVPSQDNASEFTADATNVFWKQEGPTWEFFLPNVVGYSLAVRYPDVEVGNPTAIIASTNDFNIAVAEERLSFFLVGFSILMLQPILEAIFRLEVSPQSPAAKSQEFHWPPRKSPKLQSEGTPTVTV